MITALLTAIETQTGLTVYPNLKDSNGSCIVYQYEPISDDGIKKQDRLTVRVIGDTIPIITEASNKIKQILLTVGDNSHDDLLGCYLNGGGSLYDRDTCKQHMIMYFYLITKSEVTI